MPQGTTYLPGQLAAGCLPASGTWTFSQLVLSGNAQFTGEIIDSLGSPGTSGYVLSSTGSGVKWIPNSGGGGGVSSVNGQTGAVQAPAYGADTGSVNALAVTVTGLSVVTGTTLVVKVANTNTGASTIAVNGGTATAIKKWSSGSLVALAANDMTATQLVVLEYDGTQWQLVNPPGGGSSAVTSVNGMTGAVQAPAYGADTGTANALAVSVTGLSVATGTTLVVKVGHTNTGASTIAVNGGTATNIKKYSSGSLVSLASGDLTANQIVVLEYDGTQWQLINPPSASGSSIATGTPLIAGTLGSSTNAGWANYTIWARIPGSQMSGLPSKFKVLVEAVGGTGISLNSAYIFATNHFSTTTLSSAGYAPVQITWNGGSASYAVAFSGASGTAPFQLESDSISGMTFDALHDYWVVIYLNTDGTGYNAGLTLWGGIVTGSTALIWQGHASGNVMPSSAGGTSISTFTVGSGSVPLMVGLLAG